MAHTFTDNLPFPTDFNQIQPFSTVGFNVGGAVFLGEGGRGLLTVRGRFDILHFDADVLVRLAEILLIINPPQQIHTPVSEGGGIAGPVSFHISRCPAIRPFFDQLQNILILNQFSRLNSCLLYTSDAVDE